MSLRGALTVGFGFFLAGAAMYATLQAGLALGIGEVWAMIAAAAVAGGTVLFIDR